MRSWPRIRRCCIYTQRGDWGDYYRWTEGSESRPIDDVAANCRFRVDCGEDIRSTGKAHGTLSSMYIVSSGLLDSGLILEICSVFSCSKQYPRNHQKCRRLRVLLLTLYTFSTPSSLPRSSTPTNSCFWNHISSNVELMLALDILIRHSWAEMNTPPYLTSTWTI
jgi:hypothetical protein